MNKVKFEPYGDLVDQAFYQFNENSFNNQDLHNQIESYETQQNIEIKMIQKTQKQTKQQF